MDQAAADRVKQIREFAAAGWLMKPEDCMFVLSQLSASEERVRELAEGIRKMSRGYRNLVELKLLTGGYADNALQYAAEAESLLPSPPQVDIRG